MAANVERHYPSRSGYKEHFFDVAPVQASLRTALDKGLDGVGQLAKQGQAALQDASQSLRATVSNASDSAVSYTKSKPAKAFFMMAAAGAVLIAISSLMSRSHR